MDKVSLVYCIDGYNEICETIDSFEYLRRRLTEIKLETSKIFNIIFTVDIVIEEIGRISIGLDENSIITYYNAVEDFYLTSLGDLSAEGSTSYYFGDHSLMANKYTIPYEVALEVLENWIIHGSLSDKVKWTESC
ncbi:MAG: hypothetical protein LBH28_01225 [Oscillospiraceae bacterium]|jgi:hypothetical protein|nr:hypothetical protein [Oscillospiraceae bacterium]